MSIRKETIHPEGDNSVDIYPKTSFDQVEGLDEYVVGNPAWTGEEVPLSRLKIGDIIYDIPSGESGGAVYKHYLSISALSASGMIEETYYIDIIYYSSVETPLTVDSFIGNPDIVGCVGFDSLNYTIVAVKAMDSDFIELVYGSGFLPLYTTGMQLTDIVSEI